MILDRYRQQPNEVRRRLVDYTEWLDEAETISGVVSAVTPVTTPPLVVSSLTIDDSAKQVEYYVEGGVSSTAYAVMIRITTNDDQVREDEIEITVEED